MKVWREGGLEIKPCFWASGNEKKVCQAMAFIIDDA